MVNFSGYSKKLSVAVLDQEKIVLRVVEWAWSLPRTAVWEYISKAVNINISKIDELTALFSN